MKKFLFVLLALVAVLGCSLILAQVGLPKNVSVSWVPVAPLYAQEPAMSVACADQGPLEGGFDFVLWALGLAVPGAAWLKSLAKARKLARVADGLKEVISRHESPDEQFLAIAQSGQLQEAADAIKDVISSKGAA